MTDSSLEEEDQSSFKPPQNSHDMAKSESQVILAKEFTEKLDGIIDQRSNDICMLIH